VQPRKAYTLLELICVVAIIAIMAGLAYPTVTGMYGHYRLRAASDGVRAGWVRARAHAVEEGQRYRFAVVHGKGNFRIAPDSPEYWSGSLPAFDPDNPPLVLEDALPNGIRFSLDKNAQPSHDGDSSFPVGEVESSQWASAAFFEADGSAQEDVEIAFHSAGNRPVILKLRAMTGIASVKMAPVEGQR
jgi:prepilin-type N-terminal cleavage/methylation domain-containing protein